ncbi:MAG: M48 family metallopeptidase [Bacteroidales bacterium]
MKSTHSFLFAILFMISGCSTVPLTGRRQLSLVSDSKIFSLSNESYTTYMKDAKRSTNFTQSRMVEQCGKKIQQAVENYFKAQGTPRFLKGYQWEFVLVHNKTPNAFCLPGGKVVVYDGILPYTITEAGLAVVLGHEIAHAVAKHSNERISHQMLVEAGGSVLGQLLESESSPKNLLISSIYGLGANFAVMLPFSRKQEYEADKLGLIFMAMAGYNPEEAADFWKRMSQNGSKSIPEFLSTHPADQKRIASIESILPDIMNTYYKK